MTAFTIRHDPRAELAERLPGWIQPLVSTITAAPAPDETFRRRSTTAPVRDAIWRMALGVAIAVAGLGFDHWAIVMAALAAGGVFTVSGLGVIQVVVFHYCAHNGVFQTKERNEAVGRLISILFLFKYFDDYRREHIQHHRAKKLITEEDEFASFVVKVCGLWPGMSRRELWTRLALILVSPRFHLNFLQLRVMGNLQSGDRTHVRRFLAFWTAFLAVTTLSGLWLEVAVAWLLPLTIWLQIATVFRILCEHRFPDAKLLTVRGKELIANATTGVFSGRPAPGRRENAVVNVGVWAFWWLDLLTLKTLARLIVLVGDAPAHDFHHRRPGAKHWPDALYERDADKRQGCPGYPANYIDVWGLMAAIDGNLKALAAADPATLKLDLAAPPSLAIAVD